MRSLQTLADDERAIEGLPIRLVIALVVGAASLSVMMGMLSGIGTFGVTEVHAQPSPDVIHESEGGGDNQSVKVRVIDENGNPVEDATVIVKGDSARLAGGIQTAKTGEDGTANVSIEPTLGNNQEEGELEIDVKPPAGSDFTDERENTAILVVEK